jgi:hypothetical protein
VYLPSSLDGLNIPNLHIHAPHVRAPMNASLPLAGSPHRFSCCPLPAEPVWLHPTVPSC